MRGSRTGTSILWQGASALALCGALATPALAQTGDTTIEELVVTAEKREQSMQDVPVAVTAFSDATRDKLGVKTINDLVAFTPGLSFIQGLDRMSMRGIGRTTNTIGSDPGVAVYTDGFYNSNNPEAGKSPVFVDRIEILRGPQGTLYGRNSIGGTINVISKRPSDQFQAEVRGVVANYDRWELEGSITGPLSDRVRAKLAYSYVNQDKGYYRNLGGQSFGGAQDDSYIDAQIAIEASENLDLWFKYSHWVWQQRRGWGNVRTPYDTSFFSAGLIPNPLYNYATPNPGVNDPFTANWNSPFYANLDDTHQFIGEAVWHGASFDVKYLGGYYEFYYDQRPDWDASGRAAPYLTPAIPGVSAGGFPIYPRITGEYVEDKTFWSHEVNVYSTNDGPLQWLAGLYYYGDESYQELSRISAPDQMFLDAGGNPVAGRDLALPCATVQVVCTLPSAPNPNRDLYRTAATLKTKSKAVFGQVDYAFAEDWTATLGARFTQDEREGDQEFRQTVFVPQVNNFVDFTPNPASPVLAPGPGPQTRRLPKQTWVGWGGTAGVEWRPDRATLGYAKYSRGWKSGGFNVQGIVNPYSFRNETVDAFEVGLKKTWAAVLQTNVSSFYYFYHDMQAPLTVVNPATNVSTSQFLNLPETISRGVEVEAIWAPTRQLQVIMSYAYLDAFIDEAARQIDGNDPRAIRPGARPEGPPVSDGTQPQTIVGNRIGGAAPNKITLAATYRFDFDPGSLTVGGNYTWRDTTPTTFFSNNPFYDQPSWYNVDLRATWEDRDDRYKIIAYVKNATDQVQNVGSYAATVLGPSALANGPDAVYRFENYQPPRTYGVEFHYKF